MAANAQTITWSNQATAQSVTSSTAYADEVVIANNTNVAVYARSDGSAATAGNNSVVVEPGQELTIANEQVLPDEDLKPNNAQGIPNTATYADVSNIAGWTVQQGYLSTTLYSVAPNIVSVFPASATNSGTITVTFQ